MGILELEPIVMFNENNSQINREGIGIKSEYFTSEKERFKGKNIPLRQGSGSYPPEIAYLLESALGSDALAVEKIKISEEKLKEAKDKYAVFKKSNPNVEIEPQIVFGSVVRQEAARESDTDVADLSSFERKPIAIFTQYEILGIPYGEEKRIVQEVNARRESYVLDFMERYKEKYVSSVDVILDYINANASISGRAEAKKSSYDVEEAKLVRSIFGDFIGTMNGLVEKGKLRKQGFHQYQKNSFAIPSM